MIEVEVKIPVKSHTAIAEEINKLGFTRYKQAIETDIYYSGTFHNMRQHDEALRIRTYEEPDSPQNNCYLITFKGPKLDSISMTRKELETKVANPDIMNSILNSLEYYEAGKVRKNRIYYKKSDVTICLDKVDQLGTFIEVEILAESEADREHSLNRIEHLLSSIGLSLSDCITTSYLTMLQNK